MVENTLGSEVNCSPSLSFNQVTVFKENCWERTVCFNCSNQKPQHHQTPLTICIILRVVERKVNKKNLHKTATTNSELLVTPCKFSIKSKTIHLFLPVWSASFHPTEQTFNWSHVRFYRYCKQWPVSPDSLKKWLNLVSCWGETYNTNSVTGVRWADFKTWRLHYP